MSRIWTPWTSQPQVPIGIDYHSPLSRGIYGWSNPLRPKSGETITGTKLVAGRLGIARGFYSTLGAGTTDCVATDITGTPTGGLTWLFIASQNGTGGGGFGRIITQNDYHILVSSAADNLSFSLGASAPYWTVPQLTAVPSVNVITYAGGTADPMMWRNGVPQTVTYRSGTRSGAISSISQPVRLGNRADGTRGHDGTIGLFVMWSRVLSGAEAQALSENPWQIFQPLQRRIYVDMGAGSGGSPYTFNAETGDFAITGSAATLAATRTLSADTGSYSITGQSATLSAGKSLNAAPGSFNITGQESTLVASRVLAANSGSITISGTDATLDYSGSGATLDASAGSFALTGANASLLRTYAFNAETGALVITGSNATLSYSGSSATTLTAADLAAIAALIPTVEQIAAAVLAVSVETGATVAESLRLSNAVLGGKVSGAGTGTETFRNLADTKDRLVVTVDSSGNRTAITLDLD